MKKSQKNGSKILASVLSLLLLCSLAQIPVYAETSDEVWVNGVDISTTLNNTLQCGRGTANYDKNTNTLTLNNAQITAVNTAGYGIESKSDRNFNIVLHGSNSIDISKTTGVFGYTDASMYFSGGGSLDIKASQSISNYKDITFDNVTIMATSDTDGAIVSDGNITLKNEANVTCSGLNFGFHIAGDMKITNSTVNATATATNVNAFFITGKIDIEQNSDITATSYYPSLFSNSDINISDSSVNATSQGDMGIWSKTNLVISGNSEVISKGTTGSIGAYISFKIIPPLEEAVEVFSGTDSSNVTTLEGSPFSAEKDLKSLNAGSNMYFHSKVHTHVASSTWFKDATNHWHECTANDSEQMDLASHTFGEWIMDTPATESTKGSKHRACTVCGERETVDIPATGVVPEKPVIIAGAGSTHQISINKDMTLTCSGKLEDLTGVYVDDKLVDRSNYTLKSGSTILTLKASYLNTLSTGKHTLKFQYKDNVSAETDFTITAKPSPPKTGDTSNTMLYLGLIVLSGCVAVFGLKKKKYLNK